MPVFETLFNKALTFTDATGISFVKNPTNTVFSFNGDGYISIPYIPAYNENGTTGGRLEVTVNPNSLTASNQFIVSDQNVVLRIFHNGANNQWRARNFNALNIDRVDFQDTNEHVHSLTWTSDLLGEYLIDGVAAGLTSQNSATVGSPLIFGNNQTFGGGIFGSIKDIKFFDAVTGGNLTHHWPINEGTGTVIKDVVGGSSFNGALTPGTGSWVLLGEETATAVSHTAQTISPTDSPGYNMTWSATPIAGDIVKIFYNGTGNYTYESAILGDPPIPLAAQEFLLVNCSDPAGTYQASIYDGVKNVNGTEALASGVTGVRIMNAVGVGTVALLVDGVPVLPLFDTTTANSYWWPVSGTNISWTMTGVTSFQLGQGKVI